MSWWSVLALSGAAYALKAAGLFLADRVRDGTDPLDVLVVPLLGALIAVQTLDGGERLVADARIPAILVAGFLVWRRAPLLVVVVAAGATAALLRAL